MEKIGRLLEKLSQKTSFWLVLIVVLSLIQTRFLFQPGFYTFSDELHIANLHQMVQALEGGQIPPRWAPNVSFNFGYPLFNFYYLLPFYLGAGFHLLFNLSLIWSLKLVFALSVPLSGIFFFFLLRKFANYWTSFAGSILYIFTPYRAVDLYSRGAVGEMWGFVFMPLLMWAIIELVQKPTYKRGFWGSLALAGLMISHNLTPIIFLPFLLAFSLFYIWQKKNRKRAFIFTGLSLVLGFSLSAFYWLPAIIEKSFIKTGTPFNPYDHFPFISQLIKPFWGYGASVWGPGDGLSFQIGIANLLVLVLVSSLFIFKKRYSHPRKEWLFIFLALSFLLTVFLMNIRSWFLWTIFPLGDYIQFPWRLLMLTTFFTSMMVVFVEKLTKPKTGIVVSLIIAVLAVSLTWNYFRPAKQLLVDDNYFLRRFFVNQLSGGITDKLSWEYWNYSEDYLPLTIWTKEKPKDLPPKIVSDNPGAVISTKEKNPTDFEINVKSNKTMNLVVNSYYFPGWEAKIDNRPAEINPIEPYGQIEISDIPEGNYQIEVAFHESKIRKVADYISLFSLLTLLSFLFLPVKHNKNELKE